MHTWYIAATFLAWALVFPATVALRRRFPSTTNADAVTPVAISFGFAVVAAAFGSAAIQITDHGGYPIPGWAAIPAAVILGLVCAASGAVLFLRRSGLL